MKSKFKKLLATALVLCLVLALLPAAAFADYNDLGIDVEFYDLSGAPDNYGSKGSVVITKGTGDKEYVITATPSEGYGLTTIRVTVGKDDSVSTVINTAHNSSTTFSDTFTAEDGSKVSVYASFLQMYAITVNSTTNGTVIPNVTEAFAGGEVTLTVTPNAGYSVNSVSVTDENDSPVNVTGSGNTRKFNMPASAVTVGATFVENITPVPVKHNIYCNANINGGSVDSDKYAAEKGQTVTITATPNAGYKTVGVYYQKNNQSGYSWQAASNNGNGTWSFNMPDYDVFVSAIFMLDDPGYDYHYITVSNPGSHCTVDVKNWAYCGEYVTINLSNFDAGYAFSYLKVNGEYVTPYGFNGYLSYTFKMPHNNVAIEVGTTSVSGKYYIDTSYDSTLGGVEVWVNNNYVNNWHQGSWADYKDSVSFKVKPYYSDDVVSVSVVGKRTGWTYSYDYNSYSGWYTFSMPSEDVTISVDFRSGVHKVYVDKVTDGKLTVSDDWAKYGQIVYITAVPDYGCTLSSLSVRTATGDSVHVYNAQKADTYYFYMPDQYVSVSAVFTGKYTSLPFNDVSYGDWYYDAVQFVYSKGIMDGVDYYKFAPNGTITRGMIVTMLWRMAGEPFEMPVTSFTDVEIGRYYTTAVAWACRNGIADGMGESTFGPNDAITREELVTLLYRYAQYFGHSCIGTSIEGFADAGSVSSYAYNAMCWAYKAGVVTGTTGSRLNPQGTASRAEAAQMIMSFYSFLNS